MLPAKVFQNLSRRTGLKAEALEKDYVMNLILDAIAHCPQTRDSFFFKGGCCIHKCFSEHMFKPQTKGIDGYFLNGRFSSDIDLTIRPEVMSERCLNEAFGELKEYLQERHGLQIEQFSFPIHESTKQKLDGKNRRNCRGIIHFKGPMYNPKFNAPALKFDITADERVVFKPYKRLIYHPYAHEGQELVLVALTYTLRDMFAEKVRALFERCSPRDVYDLNTLICHPDLDKRRKIGIGLSIMEKFYLKKLPIDLTIQRLTDTPQEGGPSFYDKCQDSWRSSLSRQMPFLPDFETYWQKIPEIIQFSEKCVVKARLELEKYQIQHKVDSKTAAAFLMKAQNSDSSDFQRIINHMIPMRERLKKEK